MENKVKHTVTGDKIIIEMLTNRFTHDLVEVLKNAYPHTTLIEYDEVEFNLHQIKMIDSSSIGFLFETHNKLSADGKPKLTISVGDNTELRELLRKFQVDLLLRVK